MNINWWNMLGDTFSLLIKFWPIWVFILCLLAIRIMFDRLNYEIEGWKISKKFQQGKQWRTGREMIKWLRDMSPEDFEKYISELFRCFGYKVEVVGGAHDGGVDVIAEKNKVKNYIQCKRYSSKNQVSVGSIRDFYGTLADHLANGKGYLITTGHFTLDSEKFAEDKPIELVDGHKLLEYIRLAEGGNSNTNITSEISVCPKCGGSLVERKGKFGKFLGCSDYPKCRYTIRL